MNPCHLSTWTGLRPSDRTIDFVLLDAWCRDQLSVEVVAPGVIRALEDGLGRTSCVVAQHRTAVAAHVIERVQLAVVVAGDQNALARRRRR